MTDQSVRKDKRECILQAAASLFMKEGYFKVTMDMVAEKAGVAKGTLYLYFKNKDELFACVIQSRVQKVLNDAVRVVDASRSLDELIENLFLITDRIVKEMGVYKGTGERFMELPVEVRKKIKKRIPERVKAFNTYIGKIVKGFVPGVRMEPEYIGEVILTLTIRSSVLGEKGFKEAVKRFIKNGLEKEEK